MSLFTFNFNVAGDEAASCKILSHLHTIMSTQQELATQLRTVTAQLNKISTESTATLNKVTELQAIIDGGAPISDELQTAFDELKAQIQRVDDLVPDVGGPTGPSGPSGPSSPQQTGASGATGPDIVG